MIPWGGRAEGYPSAGRPSDSSRGRLNIDAGRRFGCTLPPVVVSCRRCCCWAVVDEGAESTPVDGPAPGARDGVCAGVAPWGASFEVPDPGNTCADECTYVLQIGMNNFPDLIEIIDLWTGIDCLYNT